MTKRPRQWLILAIELLVLLVVAGLGYRFYVRRNAPEIPPAQQEEATAIESLVVEEELILALSPRLKQLDRALRNLSLPDRTTRELFTESVEVTDLASGEPPAPDFELPNAQIDVRHWHFADGTATLEGDALQLLTPLVESVEYFEHGHFYFVDAKLQGDAQDELHSKNGLSGLARTREGSWRAFKCSLKLAWKLNANARSSDATSWRIASWKVVKLETQDAPRKLFAEVLDRVLPNPSDLTRARECLQAQYNIRFVKDPQFVPPHPQFFVHADDKHPGLAVVDIDSDGWDDLYVMDLWGRNLLLRNRGDGTFQDVAARYGLDLRDHCSCAVFADFDNDGDPDVFIGRTQARSLYLRNDEGKFVDGSDSLGGMELPYFVSSINAVDIDNDGLLDVYFSTYAGNQLLRTVEGRPAYGALMSKLTSQPPLLEEYLGPEQAQQLAERFQGAQIYLDRPGPPNLLLSNRGGHFELAQANQVVEAWRNTFQSAWADYDGDGDQDCYVSNDYAPDNLLRNDGQGNFVDVSLETGVADGGFGMGASWGDYDEDGRQDLYVSNMFSKAGRRITGKMGDTIDARIATAARGNSLFRRTDEGFDLVSGLEAPSMTVEMAGWSWGSQFVDVDSDGCLDIFALSGFYSAPKEIAIELDL